MTEQEVVSCLSDFQKPWSSLGQGPPNPLRFCDIIDPPTLRGVEGHRLEITLKVTARAGTWPQHLGLWGPKAEIWEGTASYRLMSGSDQGPIAHLAMQAARF